MVSCSGEGALQGVIKLRAHTIQVCISSSTAGTSPALRLLSGCSSRCASRPSPPPEIPSAPSYFIQNVYFARTSHAHLDGHHDTQQVGIHLGYYNHVDLGSHFVTRKEIVVARQVTERWPGKNGVSTLDGGECFGAFSLFIMSLIHGAGVSVVSRKVSVI